MKNLIKIEDRIYKCDMTAPISTTNTKQLHKMTLSTIMRNVYVTPILTTPHSLFIGLIDTQKKKEDKIDIWKNSKYKDLVKLQSNNAGIVGERFIKNICDNCGIFADVDGTKTKKTGGGNGDGYIMNRTVEIKTAHQGSTASNFQHELGENPWSAEFMIFVDISPDCIYLTIFDNYQESSYKAGAKCIPLFPTKKITQRKKIGAYKLDTTVSINEINVDKKLTLKIDENTDMSIIKKYIETQIHNKTE